MDPSRFLKACQAAQQQRPAGGIGTLGEKTLHAVLKYYITPDAAFHEQKLGRFIADVFWQGRVYEVQTGSFTPLRRKLEALLPEYPVTVLYPVAHHKTIVWLDPQTGAVTQRRRSPKTGSVREIYYELCRIQPWLKHPNLQLRILLIDLEEYRLQDGWGKNGKRGASRCERIPLALFDEVTLPDYSALLPPGLPDGAFTFRDFQRCAGLSECACRRGLSVLVHLGILRPAGKQGRALLYQTAGSR